MAKRSIEDIRVDVARATVKLPAKEGQGVLVSNGYVVTAAHCLEYDSDTGISISLGDHTLYEIETASGEKIQLAPMVIETISDIAVLGALDGQTYPPEMVEPFEAFCERTRPVPLRRKRFDRFPAEFGIHIYTHKKTWAKGKGTVYRDGAHQMWIDADEILEGGTSGGPIIDDSGRLIGVVSSGGGTGGVTSGGRQPVLLWALPRYVYRQICGS